MKFVAFAFLIFLLAACRSFAAPPNILFAIADDQSFPHAGAYGTTWVKTPAFDRVAREGLLFTHAYTANAKCAPSRACIITGRNSWQLKAAANHVPFFPPEFKSYPEALKEHGWFVGCTAKGWAPGVANDADGKPRQLTGRPFNARKNKPPTSGISRIDYAANFEDFLNAAPPGKPWCFWYGATEPHRGYEYQSGAKKGGKHTTDIDHVPAFWPDNDVVRNDLLDYAFEIEWFDLHLGRMIKLLEERGLLDNTLIVVTADNGMPFPRVKGQEYEMSNHLPLAIRWPKGIKNPGRVIDDYVSFIDFAPTFVEVAGLKWSDTGMAPSPGRSLTDIFNATTGGLVNPARDHVLIGKERHDVGRPNDWGYPIRGIVKDGLLYLENFETNRWPAGNPETGYLNTDGSPTKTEILNAHRADKLDLHWTQAFGKRPGEEMFDVRTDRECLVNVAGLPAYAAVRESMREQMIAELKAQGDPRMFGQGHVFDDYPYADARTRDFYNRFMNGEKINAGWVNKSDFETPEVERQ
ncbi:sulfatase-like hydrolase/transferase [bacterium]|nr:sulfatase-like hydrolase/transferase [bacterium]